jgi:ubiquitin C-terminal hydrolase
MEIEMGLSRFKNIDGVSCYMISIMHILQQLPSLRKFVKYNKHMPLIQDKINDQNIINNFVVYEFARAIKLSLENDNIKIAPYTFKKLMGNKNSMWAEIEHQDSQEFYIYLITKIEEECGQMCQYIPHIIQKSNSSNPINTNILQLLALKYIQNSETKDYSIIKDMFVGYLISNTQCCYCYTNSPCFESFITLPISIPIDKNTSINNIYTLEQCLDNMIKDEQLDKDNKLRCDICGLKNKSIKKVQLWKAPQILVIQLKRFITNVFGVPSGKIINPILYPVHNFNMTKYFHPDSPYIENVTYNLIGINVHREIGFGSINAGHYVSIVKNKYNNKWYVFDDAKDPEELEENEIQNRNAYLLFYYRSN